MRFKLYCLPVLLLVFHSSLGSPGPGEPPPVISEEADKSVVVSLESAVGSEENKEKSEALPETSKTENENDTAPTVVEEEEPKNTTDETIESIVLPEVGSAAKEHSSSLAIFFLLFILILSIFLLHGLLKIKFHYLPESLAMGRIGIFRFFPHLSFCLFSVPGSHGGSVHDGTSRG